MTFDLSTIKSSNRSVNLQDPRTGEDLGLVFHLRAPDAEEVQAVSREWQDRKLHPKHRNKPIKSIELEALQDKRILASVTGWDWEDAELSFGGEQPKFSDATLRKWIKEHKWIRDFLTQETEDVLAFFG